VVEDNEVNQQVIGGLLDYLGYSMDLAGDGIMALEKLREIPYAVILTDCMMPRMDGYELSRMVRDPSTQVLNHEIPIIAITAHSMASDREVCLAAGMNDYVAKPVRIELLEETLKRWVGETPPPMPAESPSETPQQLASPSLFDADDLVERLMGNVDLAKRIGATFVDSLPDQLAAFAAAIEACDAQAIRSAAHAMKGNAANIGGPAVSSIAAKMERLAASGDVAPASSMFPELEALCSALSSSIQTFCEDVSDPTQPR
jgi:CheY-like chemotaxis protein